MSNTRIQFLGTGTAFHTDGRGSQAIGFTGPEGAFLVDVGPTTMKAINRDGYDLGSLDRLFLTHLHGDHTGGWPYLLLDLQHRTRRRRPLEVVGPSGTGETLRELARWSYGDLLARERLEFELRVREWEVAPGREMVGGFGVTRVPMKHHPSSLAYVFELGRRRVAVSGDTGWCEALVELGGACDLLIVECTTVEPDLPVHVSLAELREGRHSLAVPSVYLVHLTDDVAAALEADPIPGVRACHDGMALELD